jgi:hypothetical protein
MVHIAGGVLGTEEVLVLMQAALQVDHTAGFLSHLFLAPAADHLCAKDMLQLGRPSTSGSSTLGTPARRVIIHSKGWSSVSAEDKLALLPMLLLWLGVEFCRVRLQTVKLEAKMASSLAQTVCTLWGNYPVSASDCGCWAKLQAGKAVLCCADPWRSSCAAKQLSMVLLPAAAAATEKAGWQRDASLQYAAASVANPEEQRDAAPQYAAASVLNPKEQRDAAPQYAAAGVLNPEEQHGVRHRLGGIRCPAVHAASVQQPIAAVQQTRFSVAVDTIMAGLIVWLALLLWVYMRL